MPAKVSLVRCDDYDSAKVFEAVKRAIDLVGGIDNFVSGGTRVLVKPNLLSARTPEEAVDTHPEVVRAVVKLVKEAGATPVIGDSPGGYYKDIESVLEKSGMKKMAAEEGVEIVRFTASRFVDGIPIARHVFEADCVISLPKFKTHCITVLTGAIKNMYGTITGLHKAQCHSKAPKEKDFAKVVAKIYSISKPHLTVMDAITAMEGDGPSAGKPRNLNFIMAGSDGVAIDACAAKIVGVEPLDILVTKEAFLLGLGEADLSKIEITGDEMKNFVTGDFKLPQTTLLKYIPTGIANKVATLIKFKPYIDFAACKRCNLCKVSCPVNCIEIEDQYCRIDYNRCVRCLCCHEVCPYKAISIKRNVLTKFIWG